MEKLVEKGFVKSIGISNFNIDQMERLLKHCQIKPVVNQIEFSPNVLPLNTLKFCKDNDIAVMAYTPLGRPNLETKSPNFMFDNKIQEIRSKYNKSIAQIVLRYLVYMTYNKFSFIYFYNIFSISV